MTHSAESWEIIAKLLGEVREQFDALPVQDQQDHSDFRASIALLESHALEMVLAGRKEADPSPSY